LSATQKCDPAGAIWRTISRSGKRTLPWKTGIFDRVRTFRFCQPLFRNLESAARDFQGQDVPETLIQTITAVRPLIKLSISNGSAMTAAMMLRE
jgi:hypothetical protein